MMRQFPVVALLCLTITLITAPLSALPQSITGERGEPDGPITLFESRVRLQPDSATDQTVLAELYLRRARITGDVWDLHRAELASRAALRQVADYTLAQHVLLDVLGEQHRFAEAQSLAIELLRNDPGNAPAALALGDALLALGQVSSAEEVFRAIQSGDPALTARLARIEQLHGRLDAAAQDASEALNQADGHRGADASWYAVFLADVLLDAGRFAEADAVLSDVLKRNPVNGPALRVAAELSLATGGDAKARTLLERLSTLRPTDPNVAATLGGVYERLGRHDAAQRAYAQAEQLFSDTPIEGIHDRDLALFYADLDRNLDAALTLAERDLERRRDFEAFETMGWVLFRLGQFDESERYMQVALDSGVQDAELFFRAAQIFSATDDRPSAAHYFELAHAWSPHMYPKGPWG